MGHALPNLARILKKKKARKNRETGSSQSGYVSLAQLADVLRQKDPDMMKQVEALQGSDKSVIRITEVVFDLFPYAWDDFDLFELGMEQICQRDFKAAIATFHEVVRSQPDCYPAYHFTGFAYGCLQSYKQEIECYKRAAKIRPDYSQVYFDLAMAHWFQGKEKKAFAEFRRAVPLAQEFSVAEFWLDYTFSRLGRERCVEKNGENGGQESPLAMAHGCLLLGLAYLEYGLHISARHAFKKAVRIFPDFAEGQYQLGAIHIKRLRNPQRAEKYLQLSEQLFVAQGDLQKASMAHQLSKPREAVSDSDKAADDWLKEGVRLQQLERYQGAIDAYKMAVNYKPNFVDAFYNLGVAYGSLEETGIQLIHKAIWSFKKVIEIKPDFVHAYSALGASYIKQREFEEAIEVLEVAMRLEQKESTVPYYLGVACRMMGNREDAVDNFKKAVHLNPYSIQTRFYLGLTLMDLEKYADACDVLQELVKIKPDFADVHFMLGNLYMEKIGDQDKAITHLKKAEKLFAKLEDNARLSHVRQILSHQNA